MKFFKMGFISVIPIVSGIIPFGAVVGSAFSETGLKFWQAMLMDWALYAGAAQLASANLMKMNAAIFVIVITGLIINSRFLLYSAAMAPYLKSASPLTKFLCAFCLTDQSYATMNANQHKFHSDKDATDFYLGTAVCMQMVWHTSVLMGYIFGNFAPARISLDFAIALSFAALLIPTLKSKNHKFVALFSSVLSLLLYELPLRTGLMVTALISIALAWFIINRRRNHDRQ
ncbi:MAG: AzlC family ABC transporter permease [Bacteriovoracaceae bacterium]|nr:AzlC family ABC transporter permease [Bacteriovoracaceae bacterium]